MMLSMRPRFPLVLALLVAACSSSTSSSISGSSSSPPSGPASGQSSAAAVAANPADASWMKRADARTVIFTDVNVLPMDSERVLAGHSVVVQDGEIVRVAPASQVPVPPMATRVDGSGKYLLPGLAEMHGHYPPPEQGQEFTENILFLYLANGITLVRGMQGSTHHLPLRDAIERGEILGPRLLVSSPPMSGRSVTTVQDARRLVREYHQAGFDHLKVHEDLSPEVYDAIAKTANEVGVRFAGHVSNFVGLERALSAGQDTIDHLDNYVESLVADQSLVRARGLLTPRSLVDAVDEARIPGLVRATRDAGAGMVPTMVLWEAFYGTDSAAEMARRTEGLRYMPARITDRWSRAIDGMRQASTDPDAGKTLLALRRTVLRALHEGGVPILFGTDSPQLFSVPGFSIHREMQVMVECGMTRYQVLRSATQAVAAFYGSERRFGQIAEGLRADLLLVDENPIDDLGALTRRSGVMVKGRWLPESEIQRRLAAIEASR